MTSTRTDSSSEQHHGSLLQIVRSIPGAAREIWRGKQAAWQASAQLRHPLRDIEWDTDTAIALQSEVERLLPVSGKSFARTDQVQSALVCEEDCIILEEIKTLTQEHNRSNITRTAAYLECYEQYPELHWALLAHMVSRNGGYHMTDLQSDLMHNLQNPSDREHMYRLLERCNALIFQDAYPQLLLYMNSRRIGRSCFHLLSHFHVSAFMTPFWERFWLERCSSLLSVALIINEQNYIESRVMQHPYFQKKVLSKPAFHLHNLSGLNHIVFPLGKEAGLAGRVIEHFGKLDERILFGKGLYALLFGVEQVHTQVLEFARSVPHRGSRAEYWPGLFTHHEDEAGDHTLYAQELLNEEWLPEGQRLYSPELLDVWADTPYEPITRQDWLQTRDCLGYLTVPRRPWLFEMSHEHRYGMLKTALAHDAKAITH
ncbi:DUF2515 domain-containing protein [Paenibacillus sp. LS1]|uniref:DUF2515 domain-containing protein n=1 Tax=Paenibacillus sp. LS1 TaxID=2992120 RepID=UPI002230EBFA|nr:DUF2515 domain-containing protein [Paenibacillus sp. LS1]MCW3795581.1 DUF2515 domain-containing protein [Paenibacillus sp. LS1]